MPGIFISMALRFDIVKGLQDKMENVKNDKKSAA